MSDSSNKQVKNSKTSLPQSTDAASYGALPVAHGNGMSDPSQNENERQSLLLPRRQRRGGIIPFIVAVICMVLLITAGFLFLFLQPNKTPKKHKEPMYTNGTHPYNPTMILISLDGVVNHDLDLFLTPHLTAIANDGVRAQWMTPSFPPITFPNHWSLVTGLYPESHGIVGNYFYDPFLNDSFYYKSPEKSWDEKWWGGEPIWNTAVRQGVRSGTIMWPGCSTVFENNLQPSLVIEFNNDVTFDEKVDLGLNWLDLPIEDRPQFINMYVQQIDQAGHQYGPYANQTLTQLQLADKSIGRLLKGLEQRNLTDIVHLIIVSDHGMSATSDARTIFYDDEFTKDEMSRIKSVEGDPLLLIRPYNEEDDSVDVLYNAFLRLQKKKGGHMRVYKRQDIPDRFRFKNHVRIPPLMVLPDNEWIITTRDRTWSSKGVHGYDNLDPQSRAIFVGSGPTFWEDYEPGTILAPFWNVELYSLFTRILGLEPAANNGTLKGYLKSEEL